MKKFVEYVFLTLGASIVAMGLETMLAPNGLVDGGVTALSIMANALWGIPIYVVFLGLNIPILIFTAKEVSKPLSLELYMQFFHKLKSVVLAADPSAIMEASYVCETSGIDRSLILPKANPSSNKS